jgi:hypothetical protein
MPYSSPLLLLSAGVVAAAVMAAPTTAAAPTTTAAAPQFSVTNGPKLLKANLTREGWQPMPLGEYCLSTRSAGYFTARAVKCDKSDLAQQWTHAPDGSLTNQIGGNGLRLFVNFNLLLTEEDAPGHTWHSAFVKNNLTKTLNIKDGNSEFCLYAQPGANDKYFTAGFMVTLVMVEAPGTSVAVKCGDHNSIWRLDDI